jgi:predicted metal-dependent hydrolase
VIRPRTPRLGLAEVPRAWFAGSLAASHVVNGVNLLFPAGERFFVRSVHHYLGRIRDPQLRAEVKGFSGQEGRHANVHERYFDTLRAHGYDVEEILGPYEHIAFDVIEKHTPAALRLAVTVAAEHFTAILAEDALTNGELEHAHPALRNLLFWHAVEELEHKAVAFDVLRAVHPSYALRMLGLLLATACLGSFWLVATRKLLALDGMSLGVVRRELARLRSAAVENGQTAPKPILQRVFARGILEYLHPSFHPHDRDHSALVREALARLAGEGVVEGAPSVDEAAE